MVFCVDKFVLIPVTSIGLNLLLYFDVKRGGGGVVVVVVVVVVV